jgi:DNA-directed RNA polymerase specialized sigma24 family protein
VARESTPRSHSAARAGFTTTHWSVVLSAGARDDPHAAEALAKLCQAYWYPLYAYVRRRGYGPADAEDLTQEFFARLLARNDVARADPQKGRFRSFLLGGMNFLLADERDRRSALKRGSGLPPLSLDASEAEGRYGREPVETLTPERLYERAWVATLLDRASRRLRDEYTRSGRRELYDQLAAFRFDSPGQPSYADLAARLGQTEAAAKSSIWRLRRRHQELLRDEIAQTVAAADVDEEIRYLLQVMETP